jgi:hypothetical protein
VYKRQAYRVAHSEKKNLLELSQKEGELYALSAWLREAMKAKEAFQRFYVGVSDDQLVEVPVDKRRVPSRRVVPLPVPFTEKDALATFSIADLANFYTAESLAAHVGKRIHNNGVVAKIRSEILEHKENQTEFRVMNGVSNPVSYAPVFYADEIDATFQKLQEIHREHEKNLNNFKARIHNLMNDENVARNEAYKKELAKANDEYLVLSNEYLKELNALTEAQNQARASASMIRTQKLKEISAWKILIPDKLKPIYDEIVKVSSTD